jgi:flagellar basal body rod protein FlgG
LDSEYYSACAAFKQTQALELAANKIANVNSSGYRGQIASSDGG